MPPLVPDADEDGYGDETVEPRHVRRPPATSQIPVIAMMTMKMSIRLQKKSATASTMIVMAKPIMARIPVTKCGTPTSMGMMGRRDNTGVVDEPVAMS